MSRLSLYPKIYKPLKVISTTVISLAAVSGAALKSEPQEWTGWPVVQSLLKVNNHWAWLLILSAAVLSAVFQQIPPPKTWEIVKEVLEEYRGALFEKRKDIANAPEHHHRVTLFRYVPWRFCFARWPWSGWLVPVVRTGHTTHGGIPKFRAPKNHPDKAEGVVGQAWAQRRTVRVCNLPEIKPGVSEELLKEYAEKTFVSVEWLKKRGDRYNARSLLAVSVDVKGKPWGVLVVDSRSDQEICAKDREQNRPFVSLTRVLAKVLE